MAAIALSILVWATLTRGASQDVTPCATGSTSCTIPVTVAAGNVGIIVAQFSDTSTSIAGVINGGSWTACPKHVSDGSALRSLYCIYTLNTTSATSLIVNFSQALPNPARLHFEQWSFSVGDTVSIDDMETVDNTTNCTSCLGVPLTLTGPNDGILQASAVSSAAPGITAITSPYTFHSIQNQFAVGWALNTMSGAAPTWTQSTSTRLVGLAIAIKDVPASGGGGSTFTLTIGGAGTGAGKVTSTPSGINGTISGGCTGSCTLTAASGTIVTLTFTANSGSTLASVAGCTLISGQCTVNLSSNITVTPTFNLNVVTSGFSVTNQEPVTNLPYPSSFLNFPLPSNWNTHLAANSQTVADNAIVGPDCAISAQGNVCPSTNQYGNSGIDSADGGNDFGVASIYYATCSDPVYTFASPKACATAVGKSFNGISGDPSGLGFHMPSGARADNFFGSGTRDQNLLIWDQCNNKMIHMYQNGSNTASLVPGGGNIPASGANAWGYCGYADRTNDIYAVGLNPPVSLQTSPFGGTIRGQELIQGAIYHALYINAWCLNGTKVFPNVNGTTARPCNFSTIKQSNTNRPANGSLFVLDYTLPQIQAMNIPVWQKTILCALSANCGPTGAGGYGGYFGDTGGSFDTLHISHFESDAAFLHDGAVDPLWAFMKSNCPAPQCTFASGTPPNGSTNKLILNVLAGIPNVGGTGVLSHAWILDSCVAAGLDGLSIANQFGAGNPTPCLGTALITINGGAPGNSVSANVGSGTFNAIGPLNGLKYFTGDNGTVMNMTPITAPGWTFTGFSGCSPTANCTGCSGTGSCHLTIQAANGRSILTANFAQNPPPTFTITAAASGSGSGTFTSAPAGISASWNGTSLSGDTTASLGGTVTFSASPASGSKFAGWTITGVDAGACTGTGVCSFTITGVDTVSAAFSTQTSGVGPAVVVTY